MKVGVVGRLLIILCITLSSTSLGLIEGFSTLKFQDFNHFSESPSTGKLQETERELKEVNVRNVGLYDEESSTERRGLKKEVKDEKVFHNSIKAAGGKGKGSYGGGNDARHPSNKNSASSLSLSGIPAFIISISSPVAAFIYLLPQLLY